MDKDQAVIVDSEDLRSILGVPRLLPIPFGHPNTYVGKFPVDFVRVQSVMVYADIVGYDIVGNTKAPLFR